MAHTDNSWLAPFILPLCSAVFPAQAQDAAASLGKQRAAASRQVWEVGDTRHPVLGAIRFAMLKGSVETPVGSNKVFSRAYFSCSKETRTYAIELSNGASADDTGGLKPAAEPRLFCSRPIAPWDEKLVQEEMLSHWDTNEIGDSMTRGLRPFPLRECVAIKVVQEVTLPKGWSQRTAKVEFDLYPYNKEIDWIFTGCGEISAYGPAPPATIASAAARPVPVTPAAPAASAPARPTLAQSAPAMPTKAAPASPPPPTPPKAAPVVAPSPAPPASQPAATKPGEGWQAARIAFGGKTNVRAQPNLQAGIVAHLDGGAAVQVQSTGTEWWRARQAPGTPAFDGYIRQDRLNFK